MPNIQLIGLLLVIGGAAWYLFGDKMKLPAKPSTGNEEATDPRPVGTDANQPIGSRVDAVAHCEALMQYFESQNNKTGADCMRTAISSIYAPKE